MTYLACLLSVAELHVFSTHLQVRLSAALVHDPGAVLYYCLLCNCQ
jgi:hypothetical protein